MIHKRGEIPIATRKTLQTIVPTLYGEEKLKQQRCQSCGKVKNESDFYVRFDDENKTESNCIDCRDTRRLALAKRQRRENKGIFTKVNPDNVLIPINNLDEFIYPTEKMTLKKFLEELKTQVELLKNYIGQLKKLK